MIIDQYDLNSYLIHYTKLADRLEPAMQALTSLGLVPTVIKIFDGDDIRSLSTQLKSYQLALWIERIYTILPILNANTEIGSSPHSYEEVYRRLYKDYTLTQLPTWAAARLLTNGEQSVLMKHFYALACIANGSSAFGLIAEDDILIHKTSATQFKYIIEEAISRGASYVDLAGGCGLHALPMSHGSNLARVVPPRTRTNACYLVSKKYARAIINRFFPYCFPIDWHLQYILLSLDIDSCYWAVNPPFIHGSETGHVQSWRISSST